MAKYSISEFAEMCGVTAKYIRQYVDRKKIILDKNKMVDDSIDANKLFYATRKNKDNKERKIEAPTVIVPPPIDGESNGELSLTQLDLNKRKLDLEKTDAQIRLLKIQEAKLNGILIPTDLVRMLFIQHTKSIVTAMQQGLENMITEIHKRKELTLAERAEIQGELVMILNNSSQDAVRESKRQLQNIVDEYSEKRERGQKK